MSLRLPTATLACLALGLSGCGPSPSRHEFAAPVASSSASPTTVTPASMTAPPPLPDGAAIPMAVVLEFAHQGSPNRAVFEANRAGAEAAIRQARAWSNPELEVTTGRASARQENEEGNRPTTTLGGVSLKQRFELPAKRNARILAAEANRAVIHQEGRVDRLELETEVRSAVLAVASADARVIQAQRGATLSAEVLAAVQRRAQAGETDRGDLARAQSETANAQLVTVAAQGEAEAARAALRIWCADRLPAHFTVSGILEDSIPLIPLATVQAVAQHPRLAIVAERQAALLAAMTAEERAWYPDVTLGVSASRETDTNDLGVSLGIDLPLWNRNEAGIAQAQADLARNQALERKELAGLQRDVLAAWSAYDRERQQIAGLLAQVLPAAQQALDLKLAAFKAGEVSLMEVLESRRAALGVETAVREARERAAQALIALTAALGRDPLNSAPSSSVSPSHVTAPAGAQP